MIQGIIEILVNDATLVSALGENAAGTKPPIYWVFCPDTEKTPYIILRISSNQMNQVKDITSTLDQITFEAYVYGRSAEQTDAIDQAMRFAIEGKKITTSTIYFHRIYAENQADGFDKEAQKPYRVTTYTAITRRDIPT